MPLARSVPEKGPSCDGPFRAAVDGHRRAEVLGARLFITFSAAAAAQYHMHMYNPKPWKLPQHPTPFPGPFFEAKSPQKGPIWADPGRGGRKKLINFAPRIALSLRGRTLFRGIKRGGL